MTTITVIFDGTVRMELKFGNWFPTFVQRKPGFRQKKASYSINEFCKEINF